MLKYIKNFHYLCIGNCPSVKNIKKMVVLIKNITLYKVMCSDNELILVH